MDLTAFRNSLTAETVGRFPDITASQWAIDDWINRAYARVWNAYYWPWRVAPEQSLSVVAGTRDYALPANYQETWGLYDEDGNRLRFMLPREFLSTFVPGHGAGEPTHFTLMGGRLYLGPTPASSATFKWQIVKRLSHFHLGATETVGRMADATDVPIMGWDANHDDFHPILVDGALAIGMKRMQAPAAHWQPVELSFNEGLLEMVAAFGQSERGEADFAGRRVWGEGYSDYLDGTEPWR